MTKENKYGYIAIDDKNLKKKLKKKAIDKGVHMKDLLKDILRKELGIDGDTTE